MTLSLNAVSIAVSLTSLSLLVYAHRKRSDLDPAATPLSRYFSGSTRRAMLAAYLCLTLALACTAAKILLGQNDVIGIASSALICFAGLCLVVTAATTSDASGVDTRRERASEVHRISALTAFAAMTVAMTLYSILGYPTDSRGHRALRVWALLASVSSLTGFSLLTQMPARSPVYGAVQKIVVALAVIWIFLVALA